MKVLSIRNRQKVRRIDTALLKQLIRYVLHEQVQKEQYELGFHIVAAEEMAKVNEQFLQHAGSTDVITFDYNEPGSPVLQGEAYICIEDALVQANEFKTTWQSELARYAVHAILHLVGYDDLTPEKRKVMKREENRLMKLLADRFSLSKLQATKL